MPDPVKITFPLMAIAHDGRYVGVIWQPSEIGGGDLRFAGQDLQFGRARDGAIGARRRERSAPRTTFVGMRLLRIEANKPLKVSVLIIGGKGKTIVPAVKHYVI